MKKILMSFAVVLAMMLMVSCSCCNNKKGECKDACCKEKTECCADKCAGCDKADECGKTACNASACNEDCDKACDSTSTDCCK